MQKNLREYHLRFLLFCRNPRARATGALFGITFLFVIQGELFFAVCAFFCQMENEKRYNQQNNRPKNGARKGSFFHVVHINVSQKSLDNQNKPNDEV